MDNLYQITDRDLLTGLLSGEGGFHGPEVVLDGLSAEQALARPGGLPHSIAEIVAHMCYWQEWFNAGAREAFSALPEHASEGWPAVPADGWEELRARYIDAIGEAKRIVATEDSLGMALLPPGAAIPFLARESRGSGLLHAAVHNGHHLGQIVTIRQLLGLWPPAAGPMTW
ncbi:MAG: DinB family protein [Bryobacterales bacterium]|nr:DinB family protein [Bryobacterales bacterium]